MAKKAIVLLLLGVSGFTAAAGLPERATTAPRSAHSAASFTLRGKVARIVDGDTIRVRVGTKNERVRLLGIDAAELGACYSAEATAELRRLALGKPVTLRGDRTQARRDEFGRLLAYVHLANGTDVGLQLLRRGHAVIFVYRNRPFARAAQYAAAESQASRSGAGLWAACATPVTTTTTTAAPTTTTVVPVVQVVPQPPPPPPPVANCAPSYPDVCIPPPPPDLDCGQIPHRRFRVLHTVASPDPHRFDGNRDGVGCES